MLKNNNFIGLALDGNIIRFAHLKKVGSTLHLQKLDEFTLVESIAEPASSVAGQNGNTSGQTEQTKPSGDVFGFDEGAEEKPPASSSRKDEIDFEALEDPSDDMQMTDMVSDSEAPGSNAVLLYDILARIDEKKVQLGINISAGDTIFQIIKDSDFSEVKRKDLIEDLEIKLETIYGEPKSPNHYSYQVREDGSLILASVREEAALLTVLNEAKEYYSGKIRVKEIYPDEVALAGVVRANYRLKSSEITAVVQFGTGSCRFFFMKGEDILHVAPVIDRGVESANILNTIFSKILFELDSGKVPGIDQIVIANNSLGSRAIDFFAQNFPNITVQQLAFKSELFQSGEIDSAAVDSFSTAIAMAWAAAKTNEEAFPNLSFLPSYVEERQKIFKLQWHGILLLCLIFFAPLTFNYFYQQNVAQIESLNSEIELTDTRITRITPIVERTQQVSQNLALLTSKLALLDSLSTGSRTWNAKFSILNERMRGISNSWFTSLNKTQNGSFIEGYTLYRNRIPSIVDTYAEATLLNVSIDEIREEEIFRFSIMVKEFAEDSSVYSPAKPENIQQILDG